MTNQIFQFHFRFFVYDHSIPLFAVLIDSPSPIVIESVRIVHISGNF